MSVTPLCPRCARELPADAYRGLCPSCLLRSALEPDPAPEPAWTASESPSAGEEMGTNDVILKAPWSPSREPTASFDPSAEGLCSASGSAPDSAATAVSAAKIGKYWVISRVAVSGQAEVFRAVHPTLDKELILKLARREFDPCDADRDAMAREARILSELDDPGLVRVYDLDIHEGRYFLALEYVRGVTLEQYTEQSRPTPRQAAALVAGVARALSTAHRRGIYHQDVKPRNILVDESGNPRLIDFGLARWRDAFSNDIEGPSGGTLIFMAPEQARGEAVGAWSDLFALGGVLYFLLTGRAPFAGKDRRESLERAQRCDFDGAALRACRVPRRLGRIMLKAMAAEPAGRYASADKLAADLERFAHPARVAALATFALLLLALVLVSWLRFGGGGNAASTQTPPAPPLRIEAMEVKLRGHDPPEDRGAIGESRFSGRFEDDDVRVHARLTVPAYCYLIALNPDGQPQLCVPADETTPPSRLSEVTFPPDPGLAFGLTDGVGLQAFVLVASREPLPPYRDWSARLGGLPWSRTNAGRGWRFDGREFVPLEGERGAIRKMVGLPAPFAEVCRTLQGRPEFATIQAVAFPVRPSEAGATHPGTIRNHADRDATRVRNKEHP
jgi:predicted Ser/Thr protein kinase